MKKISFNFNEGGRFLTMAVNYMNLRFYIAIAIPYLWYGKYVNLERLEKPVKEWHWRYKVLQWVIYN